MTLFGMAGANAFRVTPAPATIPGISTSTGNRAGVGGAQVSSFKSEDTSADCTPACEAAPVTAVPAFSPVTTAVPSSADVHSDSEPGVAGASVLFLGA